MWAFGVSLERGEFVLPECLDLVKPGIETGEGFWSQSVDADPSVVLNAAFVDQAAAPKQAEVATHRRRCNTDAGSELGRRSRPLPEKVASQAVLPDAVVDIRLFQPIPQALTGNAEFAAEFFGAAAPHGAAGLPRP